MNIARLPNSYIYLPDCGPLVAGKATVNAERVLHQLAGVLVANGGRVDAVVHGGETGWIEGRTDAGEYAPSVAPYGELIDEIHKTIPGVPFLQYDLFGHATVYPEKEAAIRKQKANGMLAKHGGFCLNIYHYADDRDTDERRRRAKADVAMGKSIRNRKSQRMIAMYAAHGLRDAQTGLSQILTPAQLADDTRWAVLDAGFEGLMPFFSELEMVWEGWQNGNAVKRATVEQSMISPTHPTTWVQSVWMSALETVRSNAKGWIR